MTVNAVLISTVTGVNMGETPLRSGFMLHDAFPNPFNPATKLTYSLSIRSNVRVIIYDILGREIALLLDRIELEGVHSVQWNAANVPSGVYFARFEVRDTKSSLMRWSETRRILLQK